MSFQFLKSITSKVNSGTSTIFSTSSNNALYKEDAKKERRMKKPTDRIVAQGCCARFIYNIPRSSIVITVPGFIILATGAILLATCSNQLSDSWYEGIPLISLVFLIIGGACTLGGLVYWFTTWLHYRNLREHSNSTSTKSTTSLQDITNANYAYPDKQIIFANNFTSEGFGYDLKNSFTNNNIVENVDGVPNSKFNVNKDENNIAYKFNINPNNLNICDTTDSQNLKENLSDEIDKQNPIIMDVKILKNNFISPSKITQNSNDMITNSDINIQINGDKLIQPYIYL